MGARFDEQLDHGEMAALAGLVKRRGARPPIHGIDKRARLQQQLRDLLRSRARSQHQWREATVGIEHIRVATVSRERLLRPLDRAMADRLRQVDCGACVESCAPASRAHGRSLPHRLR